MKITGVTSTEYISRPSDSKKLVGKKAIIEEHDRLEISSVGKSLSNYSVEGNFGPSPEKLQSIKNEVSSGTYNRDSKLVAQKLVENMKGRIS